MLIEASIAIFLPETELELYGVTLKMYTAEGNKYTCIFGQPYEWPIPSIHVHEGDTPPEIHGKQIHHLGLDFCFHKYNLHDFLLVHLIEGTGH